MSRSSEIDEDRVYRAHVAERARVAADRALLAALVPYVLARATRCMRAGCREVALWRCRTTPPGSPGNPREDLLCDAHRGACACVPIAGADVLRAAVRSAHGR